MDRTLEDAHRGGEVVDPPGSPESSGQDGGGGNKVVGEGVVQVALWAFLFSALAHDRRGSATVREAYLELENVLDAVKLLLVPVRKRIISD